MPVVALPPDPSSSVVVAERATGSLVKILEIQSPARVYRELLTLLTFCRIEPVALRGTNSSLACVFHVATPLVKYEGKFNMASE
jgi:hypothetical protein